jgi:drug/metabolite transporter (DMT)-like permease
MVGSALAFAAMTAFVKLAAERLPSQEIVAARAAISLGLSLALLRRAGVTPLFGRRRGLLLLRGLFGFAGLSCVFYAVAHLPLAEATVLQYLHPVFTAGLAALFLRETVGAGWVGGTVLALLGVTLVARPGPLGSDGWGLDPFATGVAVAGAFFSGCAYVTVRRLAREEHPLVIVLYFPLVTLPATLPALARAGVWPQGAEWLWLAGVGVLAQLGQVWLTRGLQHEPAGRATALAYLQVVFAAGLGVAVFGDVPGPLAVGGGALVLCGALLAGRRGSAERAAASPAAAD